MFEVAFATSVRVAIADLDKALELDPKFALAYMNRGNAKIELKQYTEAIADYDKAIELEPNFAPAYTNRGNAKYNSNNIAKLLQTTTKP